jgi:hypothetical protein
MELERLLTASSATGLMRARSRESLSGCAISSGRSLGRTRRLANCVLAVGDPSPLGSGLRRTCRIDPLKSIVGWLVVVALGLTGCLGPATATPSLPTATVIYSEGARHQVAGVVWNKAQLIGSILRSDATGEGFRLVVIDPATGKVADVRPAPTRPDCLRVDEIAPIEVATGMAWISNCVTKQPGVRRIEVLVASELQDVPDTKASVLTSESITMFDVRGDSILTAFGAKICQTLGRLTADRLEPLSIVVAGPGRQFDTGSVTPGDDCSSTGLADLPASNQEGALAFFASTRAIGSSGENRIEAPFDLYVSQDGHLSRLGFSIVDPIALRWTPDGAWLIASGRTAAGDRTLRIDPKTGSSVTLLDYAIGRPSWSADSLSVAAPRASSIDSIGMDEIVVLSAADFAP